MKLSLLIPMATIHEKLRPGGPYGLPSLVSELPSCET
jgi:hypothetical protein